MYNFLVLGLVPGTNLQITFNTWLYAASLSFAVYFIAFRLRRPAAATVRAPLHASQLHNRG